ncbi:hypothetical protein RIF29_23810 [Crotalaria pallida]|uniref:Uncharacterized protein n=1 Tax=Crotalaria pallida TaxID=3830 RepID=A0AAN9F640_CROPI
MLWRTYLNRAILHDKLRIIHPYKLILNDSRQRKPSAPKYQFLQNHYSWVTVSFSFCHVIIWFMVRALGLYLSANNCCLSMEREVSASLALVFLYKLL